MPATGIPARKFAENATIRQELVQMDILPNTAVSAPAAIQEATAGIIILTAIQGKLCAENVQRNPVLMDILQNIAASAPAEKQEARAGTIPPTAIQGKLCAENVQRKPVLMGIVVGLIGIAYWENRATQIQDVQEIVGTIILTEF